MSEEVEFYTGKVVWFSPKRGYGYIAPDTGEKDFFVHFKNLNMSGFRTLKPDQIVKFALGKNDNGVMAVDVEVIKDVE